MKALAVVLGVLGLAFAAVARKTSLEEVIRPVGEYKREEKQCLFRYASTISKRNNRYCYEQCMAGKGPNNDCIELNTKAFSREVPYPCHSNYVPYFDEMALEQMVEDEHIKRLEVRSPTECQMHCQEDKRCTWYLYYNPRQPRHPTNCELLLNYKSVANPRHLEETRFKYRGEYRNDYINRLRRHMCITCDLFPMDVRNDTCGRYHPYIVSGKPFCSDLRTLYNWNLDDMLKHLVTCFISQPIEPQHDQDDWKDDDLVDPDTMDQLRSWVDDTIHPVGNYSGNEGACLRRYASTISKKNTRTCIKDCMLGDKPDRNCIDLDDGAFTNVVEFPCISHFIPYFDEKPISEMVEGKDIVHVQVRSPTECQAECQEHKECTYFLYYKPMASEGHPTNCELLLNYKAPKTPMSLEHPLNRTNGRDALKMQRHQCMRCDDVKLNGLDICARYHPEMLSGKKYCSNLHDYFGWKVDITKPKPNCRIQTPKYPVYDTLDWNVLADEGFPNPYTSDETSPSGSRKKFSSIWKIHKNDTNQDTGKTCKKPPCTPPRFVVELF